MLTFDAEGSIDASRFEKQQYALAESVVAPVFDVFDEDINQTVVDATSRFIVRISANVTADFGNVTDLAGSMLRGVDSRFLDQLSSSTTSFV
ncbi:hypothetical protein SAMN05445850_8264 [Paraburkholderia tuberum]|uniref:Uncharacterized protein n=2 Tax=Paraburkholderia tuberum TaxID=157910 RepID=A0A1H1KLD6_9BURK|nr:hypothetical protein SAMN05445850_8264 [Paraburkholderia tuberum]